MIVLVYVCKNTTVIESCSGKRVPTGCFFSFVIINDFYSLPFSLSIENGLLKVVSFR